MRGLAQDVERVGAEKLAELTEFLVVVDAQRCAVRRELDQGIEVLPLSELLLCLVIHERVELAPDIALEDVLCVLVVGAHDVYLSPHPGGMPVLSCRKSTARRPDGGEQDEISRHYFASAKITP